MGTITRLHDSGTLGQAATGLAFATPDPHPRASSVASTTTGLRVSNWQFTSAGVVSLLSTQTQGNPVSQFNAAGITTPTVVAYRHAADGHLHVASFNGGTLLHDVARGAIADRRISVVRHSFDASWYVAFATPAGDLWVSFWQYTGTGSDPVPAFVSNSGDQAGAATHIAGTCVQGKLITAVRTGGNLELITWGLDAQNGVQRLGDSGSQGGAVDDLCVSGFMSLDSSTLRFVITAAKNSSGNLEIGSWRVNADNSITRMASLVAGPVGELAITSFQLTTTAGAGGFVTATTDAGGNLVVTSWKVAADGSLQQIASASAGAASHVAVIDIANDLVATTCITGGGVEKVISWRVVF